MSRFHTPLGNAALPPPGALTPAPAHHAENHAFKDALEGQMTNQMAHDHQTDANHAGHGQHHSHGHHGHLHHPFRQARRPMPRPQPKPQSADAEGHEDHESLVTGTDSASGIQAQHTEDLEADDASGNRRLAKQGDGGEGNYYRKGTEKLGAQAKLLGWIDPGIPIGQKHGGQKRRGGNPEDETPERGDDTGSEAAFAEEVRQGPPPPPRRFSAAAFSAAHRPTFCKCGSACRDPIGCRRA